MKMILGFYSALLFMSALLSSMSYANGFSFKKGTKLSFLSEVSDKNCEKKGMLYIAGEDLGCRGDREFKEVFYKHAKIYGLEDGKYKLQSINGVAGNECIVSTTVVDPINGYYISFEKTNICPISGLMLRKFMSAETDSEEIYSLLSRRFLVTNP